MYLYPSDVWYKLQLPVMPGTWVFLYTHNPDATRATTGACLTTMLYWPGLGVERGSYHHHHQTPWTDMQAIKELRVMMMCLSVVPFHLRIYNC